MNAICLRRIKEGKTEATFYARCRPGRYLSQEALENGSSCYSGFSEIAGKVSSLTHNAVLVAHNAPRVYQTLKAEFRRTGCKFEVPYLCTERLSNTLVPHLTSYDLDYMCAVLGIYTGELSDTAAGNDAVCELFLRLLRLDEDGSVCSANIVRQKPPVKIQKWIEASQFSGLPSDAGIYTFHDRDGELIYAGKAKNIKRRILSHFTSQTEKGKALRNRTRAFNFERCGNELIALLWEADLILIRRPEGNTLQKKEYPTYHIVPGKNRQGIISFHVERKPFRRDTTSIFFRKKEALLKLNEICRLHRLCPTYTGLAPGKNKCRQFDETGCLGICQGLEKAGHYNVRAQRAITNLEEEGDFLITGEGRNSNEKSLVLVLNGVYQGFGFVDVTEQITGLNEILHLITPRKHTYHTARIVAAYILRNPGSKTVLEIARTQASIPGHKVG